MTGAAPASPAPMLADVRRQPECLGRLLGRGAALGATGREALRPEPGGRLYVVGSGDGWFAARAVSRAARRGLGLPYRARSALEFLLYEAPALTPRDRVAVVSMSGNVDRTNEAWDAARRRGVPGLVLTNGAGGRLGRASPVTVSLEIPDLAPFLCGTSTYTGTVLALLLLLAGAAEPHARPDRDPAWEPSAEAVARALAGLPGVLDEAEAVARAATDALQRRGAPGLRVLAAGPHLATAEYGAAKVVELSRVPVWSDDVEEFAHRQFWSADPGELVVYLVPSPALAERAAEAAAALAALGTETLAIESGGAAVSPATRRLALPAVPEWLAALVLPVPLQVLAYHLARATGLDPDTRTHLREDPARFRVSRLLTRRTLVDTGR